MKNIRNAKSETSHSVTDSAVRSAVRIPLYEVSDFVRSMFFKVLNFELT